MSTEQQYDEIIAPLLAHVALECQRLGMVMVARVEWEPGECGVTQIGNNGWSGGQKLAWMAAHSRGNIDALCMRLLREPGADQSVFLARFLGSVAP